MSGISISVTTPADASSAEAKRARQRAAAVERYLHAHAVTNRPSIATPAAQQAGLATITIDYAR